MPQVKPERRKSNKVAKVLSQAELLAEAARTEIENIQSLKLLLAMEVRVAGLRSAVAPLSAFAIHVCMLVLLLALEVAASM